jgi:hypothetical protein
MVPNQLLIERQTQHARLRALIAAVRRIAERVRAGESLRQELKASALHVKNELDIHNNREEELLRWMASPSGKPRAPRAESMNQQHFEEHRALRDALFDVNLDPDDRWAANTLMDALDRVVDHMAREEESFDWSDTSGDEETLPGV